MIGLLPQKWWGNKLISTHAKATHATNAFVLLCYCKALFDKSMHKMAHLVYTLFYHISLFAHITACRFAHSSSYYIVQTGNREWQKEISIKISGKTETGPKHTVQCLFVSLKHGCPVAGGLFYGQNILKAFSVRQYPNYPDCLLVSRGVILRWNSCFCKETDHYNHQCGAGVQWAFKTADAYWGLEKLFTHLWKQFTTLVRWHLTIPAPSNFITSVKTILFSIDIFNCTIGLNVCKVVDFSFQSLKKLNLKCLQLTVSLLAVEADATCAVTNSPSLLLAESWAHSSLSPGIMLTAISYFQQDSYEAASCHNLYSTKGNLRLLKILPLGYNMSKNQMCVPVNISKNRNRRWKKSSHKK